MRAILFINRPGQNEKSAKYNKSAVLRVTINAPLRSGQFKGQKSLGPLEKPRECPIICFAREKKIISRTFKIRGALVFLCPNEGEERRETRDERRETRDGRRETGDGRREARDE